MTYKEAIDCIDAVLSADVHYDESIDYLVTSDDIEWLEMAKEALERAEKKKVKDYDYALPIYDTDGYQNDVLFMCRARCPKCSYVILDGDFQKFDANDLEINFCVRCGQTLDWSDADE